MTKALNDDGYVLMVNIDLSAAFDVVNIDLLYHKLMPLGPTNPIVDDSDFKLSKFDSRFRSNSDSNEKIASTIAILI